MPVPSTRPSPICHRTIGQPKPRDNPAFAWYSPFEMTKPCIGSGCSLWLESKAGTGLGVCSEAPTATPWSVSGKPPVAAGGGGK